MEFQASLDNLSDMMKHIHREAEGHGVAVKLIHKMELACEEAIVNIISYAYPKKKGRLLISCERKGERFEITIRDYGVPFNPIDVDVNPQLDKPAHERTIGGLGIFLLRKAIDEASYRREKKENVLRLTFRIS